MPNFLLELCSEEIPARMHRGAREQLERLFRSGLEKAGLTFTAISTFSSPRHLAIHIAGLPEQSPDVTEEKKGPKLGAPEAAINGFLQSTGLTLAQCEQRQVGKDTVYFATIHRKGEATSELLKNLCQSVLTDFGWPKSMRWGARSMRWVRPLHHIVALLDAHILPVSFGHLSASNLTLGHRFLAPAPITLKHADEYEAALEKAFVQVNPEKRMAAVKAQIETISAQKKLKLVEDAGLLEEVTGLVEHPTALLGTFEESYLSLPPEVLISEMKHHQRYFALQKSDGMLSNHFIAVTNMQNPSEKVIAGNARVLRARLSDGAFYYETDRKKPLADWAKGLADVVFHAKVGMMNEKVARIETIAQQLNTATCHLPPATVAKAAQLCKADLVSGMVGEFPELQGIMGRYYAREQGESDAVAHAIYEHYKPQGAADSLPQTDLGAVLSIADKLDSIVSLFAAGEKPTGSKDPLALRRAALGVLRILLAREWSLNLADFVADTEVHDFFRERLKNLLRDEGIAHDVIEAAFAIQESGVNPVAIATRARTLAKWSITKQGKETIAALKRAQNILAAEEKKQKAPITIDAAKHTVLQKPEEQKLWNTVQQLKHTSIENLEQLAAPINAFFEASLVTEEGFREARLSLLASVRECAFTIADFSKLEG